MRPQAEVSASCSSAALRATAKRTPCGVRRAAPRRGRRVRRRPARRSPGWPRHQADGRRSRNSLARAVLARDPRRMATVIEPVRADDRAAMDGWFDLMRPATRTTHLSCPRAPLGHAIRFSWPGVRAPGLGRARRRCRLVAAAERDAAAARQPRPRLRRRARRPAAPPPRSGSRLLTTSPSDARAAGRDPAGAAAPMPSHGGSSPGAGSCAPRGPARHGRACAAGSCCRPPMPAAARPRGDRPRAARGYRLVQWTGRRRRSGATTSPRSSPACRPTPRRAT